MPNRQKHLSKKQRKKKFDREREMRETNRYDKIEDILNEKNNELLREVVKYFKENIPREYGGSISKMTADIQPVLDSVKDMPTLNLKESFDNDVAMKRVILAITKCKAYNKMNEKKKYDIVIPPELDYYLNCRNVDECLGCGLTAEYMIQEYTKLLEDWYYGLLDDIKKDVAEGSPFNLSVVNINIKLKNKK